MEPNTITGNPSITLINTFTTEAWNASDYVPRFNQPVYSLDQIDGIFVHRAKVGNGLDKWPSLPYWINPTTDSGRPDIKTVRFEELVAVGDEQFYYNPIWVGHAFRVFWQNANRYYTETECVPLETGGFKLIDSARIYESQEIIVNF